MNTAVSAARLGVVGALGLLLAGCAVPPQQKAQLYSPPTSGPTARALVRVAVTGEDIYAMAVLGDAVNCQTPRIATTGSSRHDPKAVTLAAGQLSTIDVLFVRANKQSCFVRTSLIPTAGKTYLFAGALSATGCALRVLDATQPDAIKPETTAVRRSVGTNRCIAIADAKPVNTVGSSAGSEAVLSPGATSDDLSGLLGR